MSARAAPTPARAPGPYAAGFERALVRLTPGRVPSRGHGVGAYTLELFGNEAAAKAYATDHAPFPEGATLAAVHAVRTREGDARAPVYLMTKEAAGWRFAVASSDGHVADGAALDACARCHDEAPHEAVFRAEP